MGDEPAIAPARGFQHLLLIINRGYWPHLLENDMNEETKSKTKQDIELTQQEYLDLERAMQWPEDLARYDRIAKPTNLSELSYITE